MAAGLTPAPGACRASAATLPWATWNERRWRGSERGRRRQEGGNDVTSNPRNPSRAGSGVRLALVMAAVAALAAAGTAALLANITQRKAEARNPFYRVVE